ncbi:hypothetical protein [Dactylosporangium sp. CA-233914]|uniref:hypothetical protein n=1 Tax=Dactylosporangium sp. CA-233914 TaxID=3239934 RepID=UPI003D8E79F9
MNAPAGVEIVGRGTARADRVRTRGGRPSFFADLASWLVAEAVGEAVADARTRAGAEVKPDAVAVITVSERCTLDTIRTIAAGLPAGRLSPLRFAGASPGSVGGLPGVLFGFRGPSLTLPMAPDEGLPVAVTVARSWLQDGDADFAAVAGHTVDSGVHAVRAVLLRAPGSAAG